MESRSFLRMDANNKKMDALHGHARYGDLVCGTLLAWAPADRILLKAHLEARCLIHYRLQPVSR